MNSGKGERYLLVGDLIYWLVLASVIIAGMLGWLQWLAQHTVVCIAIAVVIAITLFVVKK